jgi:endonuclease-8
MPEGDTVWRTARRLHDVLANQILVTSDFRVPAYSTLDLTGSRVREVVARGKHLLLRTEPGLTVHTHLKMDGSWQLYRVGSPWRGPGFEVRLVLASTDWVCVGFRLGIVEVLRTAAEASVVGHLGPDLLGPD